MAKNWRLPEAGEIGKTAERFLYPAPPAPPSPQVLLARRRPDGLQMARFEYRARRRSMMFLQVVEFGMTYREVGEIWGVSGSAVRVQVIKAERRIRHRLGDPRWPGNRPIAQTRRWWTWLQHEQCPEPYLHDHNRYPIGT